MTPYRWLLLLFLVLIALTACGPLSQPVVRATPLTTVPAAPIRPRVTWTGFSQP